MQLKTPISLLANRKDQYVEIAVGGYTSKILRVNLSSGRTEKEDLG